MASYIGIEIGGTKLQLVLGDGTARILERRRLKVDAARGAAGIRDQIARELPVLASSAGAAGVGIGFGGPVDWTTGCICRSHQVEGWSDFPLREWIESMVHLPTRVDNDANVATLGEAMRGAGVGRNPVFYVTLGSGVGGGLVLDQAIYHGTTPGEAEIGHVRLDRDGTIVESRCSGWAVDRKVRSLQETDPQSLLAGMAKADPGGEARHLPRALAQGDPAAVRILAETAEDLAFGLSHVVHLFHPGIIILGGGLSCVGEPLRAAVAQALPRFVMHAFGLGPPVALSGLGEDAVPIGALQLAIGPAHQEGAGSNQKD